MSTILMCVRTYVQVRSFKFYVGLFQDYGVGTILHRCGRATHMGTMGTGIAWWCQPFCSNQKVEQTAYSL